MSKTLQIKIPEFGNSPVPILVGLLVIAAFVIGVLWTKVSIMEKATSTKIPTTGGAPQAPAPGQKVNVSVGHLQTLGNKNAKVTVVEFGDFQCPFCARFFKDVEPNLIKDYVDTGKARFAFRQYAFLGQESIWAAEASECANEQGKFWDYHNYLYNNQKGENQGAFSKDNLKSFAKTLGLNSSQFDSCLDSDKYSKEVAADLADGQKAGVTGTPGTFINGQLVVGAQPYSAFKTVIDQELTK